jgi:hypothetical protein
MPLCVSRNSARDTLGDLMNINQALLYGIGVSDESLEWLINAAKKAGALGEVDGRRRRRMYDCSRKGGETS